AVDQSGNFWTADANTDNITEFDPTGTFLQQWNDTFGTTLAIAVDATHNAVYLIRGFQTANRFTLTGTNGPTEIDHEGTGVARGAARAGGPLTATHAILFRAGPPGAPKTHTTILPPPTPRAPASGRRAALLSSSPPPADPVTIYGPPTPPGPPAVFSESA